MTLLEFLEARITDAERRAVEIDEIDGSYGYAGQLIGLLRAECAVKRQIIKLFREHLDSGDGHPTPEDFDPLKMSDEIHTGYAWGLRDALFALAAPYSGRTDFNPDWTVTG